MMNRMTLPLAAMLLLAGADATADPCGMVPPLHISPNQAAAPIQRIGAQRTYVFFRDGIETIALRPGFQGSIDEFGMLSPFPSPPAIRKIDDDTFAHIEGAITPPEVDVFIQDPHVISPSTRSGMATRSSFRADSELEDGLAYNEVNVVREEAVGMYQVAVLEAGSTQALSRWMADNGYRFPDGMEDVTDEYVEDRWCFVAVKARVGQGPGVTARPGMRQLDSQLPDGASFDGYVQGMAFRFHTDAPVVPMRLSVFNGPDPRNVVYMLADQPLKIQGAPRALVVGQLDGEALHANLTEALDVNYHNGTRRDISGAQADAIEQLRDPTPFVRAARDLFAADMLAVRTRSLSLPFEEEEKALLNISEQLGLRGEGVDVMHATALEQARGQAIDGALDDIREMHLTVFDGVIPGYLIAEDNLTFNAYNASGDLGLRRDPLRPVNLSMTVMRRR
jgi:hypothetical protein